MFYEKVIDVLVHTGEAKESLSLLPLELYDRSVVKVVGNSNQLTISPLVSVVYVVCAP